ncbi:DUF2911 domain-containing protein [bacterium]|nr:MAG: DUF2911 domain-containing protein [bacterium]
MRKTLTLLVCMAFVPLFVFAQLTTPPNGGNKKASVSEWIGITKIELNYSRPGVKGREGKIWGTQIAHYGFQNLGFGTAKTSPWRAGANENTTIEFSTDVMVEGKPIKAGKYGLFMALEENETTIIFSSNSTTWGSFFYNPDEDVLRVTVKNQPLNELVEWMKFEFINQTSNSASIALMWEKRMIPFTVSVDLHALQIASFKKELQTTPGFDFRNYVQAATYCLNNDIELEQGLSWADAAGSMTYVGQKNFQTLSIKAKLLDKLGKTAEAQEVLKEAVPMGSIIEIHVYARELITQKRTDEALALFELNYKKDKNDFTTNYGMARGYSAKGDFKKAQKYLQTAIKLAPDDGNKQIAERYLTMLKENKDIN